MLWREARTTSACCAAIGSGHATTAPTKSDHLVGAHEEALRLLTRRTADMNDGNDAPDARIIAPLVYLAGIVIGFLATRGPIARLRRRLALPAP
jgi:hypothetical protein